MQAAFAVDDKNVRLKCESDCAKGVRIPRAWHALFIDADIGSRTIGQCFRTCCIYWIRWRHVWKETFRPRCGNGENLTERRQSEATRDRALGLSMVVLARIGT